MNTNTTLQRYETMRKMIDVLELEYGGAEGYLTNSLGFSDADILCIRDNLLSREAAML